MKRAILKVTDVLLSHPAFQLPDGYKEVWSIRDDQTQVTELFIDGPFPECHEDGDRIAAYVGIDQGAVTWKWQIGEQVFDAEAA